MKRLFHLLTSAIIWMQISTIITPTYAANNRISVMTFNIENGGTQISFDKVAEAIRRSKADVVAIQEAWGNTDKLAAKLKWKYVSRRYHVISRLPMYELKNKSANYVLIEVDTNHFVALANTHLPDEPYGPDLIKKGMSSAEVIKNERITRLAFVSPIIKTMAALARQQYPVFITGDFNSPSHLDWTLSTVNKKANHRYVLEWPVTKAFEHAGLIDSYRFIHADPVADRADTWPSGRPVIVNAIDNFNPSTQDLSDRIDFIFTGGPAKIISSEIIGEHTITPWPSDHRAVVSKFEVIPRFYEKSKLKAAVVTTIDSAEPVIKTNKVEYHVGEPIIITWANAPGYRYDYISIVPVKADKKQFLRSKQFYTFSKRSGSISISANNSNGNWPEWFLGSTPEWPLAVGKYKIKLMLDDSYTSLASVIVEVR